MELTTLLKNFSSLFSEEESSPILKLLIFELSVNGRLNFNILSNGKIKKDFISLIKDQKINLNQENIQFETEDQEHKWPMVKLKNAFKLYQPQTISQKEMKDDGKYIVFGANGPIGRYDKYNHSEQEVLITCRGATCGTINISDKNSWITGNAMVVQPLCPKYTNKKFLFYVLYYSDLSEVISGSAQPQITQKNLGPFCIPLPPISVQNEIVKLMEECEHIKDQINKEKNLLIDLSKSLKSHNI